MCFVVQPQRAWVTKLSGLSPCKVHDDLASVVNGVLLDVSSMGEARYIFAGAVYQLETPYELSA